MAYFEEAMRSADVVTDGATTIGILTYDDLTKLGQHEPILQEMIIHMLATSSIKKLRTHLNFDENKLVRIKETEVCFSPSFHSCVLSLILRRSSRYFPVRLLPFHCILLPLNRP